MSVRSADGITMLAMVAQSSTLGHEVCILQDQRIFIIDISVFEQDACIGCIYQASAMYTNDHS